MVTVVIPIYNVSRFIDRGVQQILKQNYQDFELLLVDDGSTDDSLEECQKWADSDTRIKVFHKENEGAGSARNYGINHASGEYIYFFDIDDEADIDLLYRNVDIMEKMQVEMIIFGYRNQETSYNSEVIVEFPETLITTNNELRNLYVDNFVMKVNGFPWNKFYRKAFLDKYNLRYENQRIQQDEVFNLKCYRFVERMYLSPMVLYTYYIYPKGNTRSRFIADRFDIYKSVRQHFDELISFWQLDDRRLDDYLNERFFCNVIQCFMFNITHPDCIWSRKEKKIEMERINADCYTIQAYEWASRHDIGFENRIAKKICQIQNLHLMHFFSLLFNAIHNINKSIKK